MSINVSFHLPAKVASSVAGGVALLGEAVAEEGLRLHDDVVPAAVEEQVVILRGEPQVGARVEAEGGGGPELVPIAAAPHGGVRDEEVWVRVADVADRVPPGRGPQLQLARVGADEDAAVGGAAAPLVHSERVADRNITAGASAFGF